MYAVLNAKLCEHPVEMLFDAPLSEPEHVSDLFVAQPRGRQRGGFMLSGR